MAKDADARAGHAGHPGGEHLRAPHGVDAPGGEARSHRRHQPHGELLGAVAGDLGRRVAERPVAEARQRPARRSRRGPSREGRRASGAPRRVSRSSRRVEQHRVGDGLGHRVVAGEQTPVGERRVRGVEDPQLGLLVDERHRRPARRRPVPRAAARSGKVSSSTHCVNGSVTTGQASSMPSRRELLPVLGCRRRNHPVDHRRGEGHVAVDPVGERGVAALGELARPRGRWRRPFDGRLSQDATVNGAVPPARRRTSASSRRPGSERGACGRVAGRGRSPGGRGRAAPPGPTLQ